MTPIQKNFLGGWKLDKTDLDILKEFGDSEMEFRPNDTVIYTILGEYKDEIMVLTYEIFDDVLITDQPSHPLKIMTKFYFEDDNILVLNFNDKIARYLRKEKI